MLLLLAFILLLLSGLFYLMASIQAQTIWGYMQDIKAVQMRDGVVLITLGVALTLIVADFTVAYVQRHNSPREARLVCPKCALNRTSTARQCPQCGWKAPVEWTESLREGREYKIENGSAFVVQYPCAFAQLQEYVQQALEKKGYAPRMLDGMLHCQRRWWHIKVDYAQQEVPIYFGMQMRLGKWSSSKSMLWPDYRYPFWELRSVEELATECASIGQDQPVIRRNFP